MRVIAPAKINLHLRVGPVRHDGFHPLLSWMVTVSLFDTLIIEPAEGPGIRMSCDDPSLPCDGSNLVLKAASAALAAAASGDGQVEGSTLRGWTVALQKRIPVGAGLGGGSSDGAAALRAFAELLKLGWTAEQLGAAAARFGSDIPFFMYGPSSICRGRGEIVSPIAKPRARWAVLILPGLHVSTPAVYRRFDEMKLGDRASVESPDASIVAWAGLPAGELLPRLVNDLEAPAFAVCPALADLHARAGKALGRIVRMSGSGSTLFTLLDSEMEANEAARDAEKSLGARAVAVEVCPDLRDGE